MPSVVATFISLIVVASAAVIENKKVMLCKPSGDGSGKPDVPAPIVACEGKDEGELCNISGKSGMQPLNGTCTSFQKVNQTVMWCKPTGDQSGKPEMPPPVVACEGKDEGEPCDFSGKPSQQPLSGTCALSQKRSQTVMWCKLDGDKSGKPEMPPLVVACEGKDEGEPCDFSGKPDQQPLSGTCALSQKRSQTVMWCKLDGDKSGKPEMPPPVVACESKDEGETCNLSEKQGVQPLNGTCISFRKKEMELMWCKPSGEGGVKPEAHPDAVACEGKKDAEPCEFLSRFGNKHISGRCKWSDGAGNEKAIESGDTIFLRTISGSGNHIDVEGGAVQARWVSRGAWQALLIEKQDGGIISSGDTVFLKAHTGANIDVRGHTVNAEWNDRGDWQSMVVEKRSGGAGVILSDDLVCLRAHTGKHLDVVDTVVQARFADCGERQTMAIEKEASNAVFSRDYIHLLAHTGKRMDVEGQAVQARWSDAGEWQTLSITNYGGRAIFSGDSVFLKAHTGMILDVQGVAVQARYHELGSWQQLIIENKKGSGAIHPGDTIYLRAHTGNILDVEGTAVQARWHDRGQWQSLVIEKTSSQRRLIGTKSDESAVEAPSLLII